MLQHCQVVVLQEDIGTAYEISKVSFVIFSAASDSYVEDISLSMAHVESDQLTETFTDNYQPGSLVEVCHMDLLDLSGENGDEILLDLDTPFQYNGQDNLLIDISYPAGSCWTAVYTWDSDPARSLRDGFLPSGSAGSTGELLWWVPYMVFEGTESLEQNTFGAIKIELGGMRTEQ